jgi:deazaflavin-dependent oxidoreductase (nitroreductase family)
LIAIHGDGIGRRLDAGVNRGRLVGAQRPAGSVDGMSDMNDMNQLIIEEFRANGGKVGHFGDADMVIVHHVGAKTGKERETPLVSRVDGDKVIVFGSKGGGPAHPDWYHNLVANPKVRIEIGTETRDVIARVAEGEERARIWSRQMAEMPGFAEYEGKAAPREIPVVVLEPAS